MKTIEFEEQNHTFHKPKEMTDEECVSLPCCVLEHPYPQTISCWELTKEEIEQIVKTGKLWVSVFSVPPPPIAILTETPFTKPEPIEPIDAEDA